MKNIGAEVIILAKENTPGYLSVKIANCNLELQQVKFFGVNEFGGYISGVGVTATEVKKYGRDIIAWFDIEELVKKDQFTDQVVEGVITISDREIGRDSIRTEPAVYLG
ncbi:hypothetical protein JCM16358_12190 [Halanaerocella petrolearia]